MDAFGNTSVMTALADPGKFRHKILVLMTEFSKFGMLFEEHAKDSLEPDDVPVLIGNVARAFCVLLTPFAKHGASASHLQKVTSYKGTSVVMQAFKEIIQKNPIWQRFVNELVSKGAATATWGSKLDELVESLQNTEKFSSAFFAEAASLFPKMKSEMRSGSTDLLEKLLLLKTQTAADEFLGGQMAMRSVSMADALISCLGCFHASKGVLQLVSKLNSFKESNAVDLAKQEIMDVLSSYPRASSELPVPEDAAGRRKNIVQIHDMLQQVGSTWHGNS